MPIYGIFRLRNESPRERAAALDSLVLACAGFKCKRPFKGHLGFAFLSDSGGQVVLPLGIGRIRALGENDISKLMAAAFGHVTDRVVDHIGPIHEARGRGAGVGSDRFAYGKNMIRNIADGELMLLCERPHKLAPDRRLFLRRCRQAQDKGKEQAYRYGEYAFG